MYKCINVYVYVNVFVYAKHMYMYMYVYVCIYIYVYVYVYAYVYVWVGTHNLVVLAVVNTVLRGVFGILEAALADLLKGRPIHPDTHLRYLMEH